MGVVEPKTKKARLSSPPPQAITNKSTPPYDLKIVCGEISCLRYNHYEVMKTHSGFIASNAKLNQKENIFEVEFPLLDVALFDAMIKFVLDTPVRMTIQDAISLAKPYATYAFARGQRLCEERFLSFFQRLKDHEKELSLDVSLFVKTLLLCRDLNLKDAEAVGVKYLKTKLLQNDDESSYGCLSFTKELIAALVPIIAEQVEADATFRSQFPFKTRDCVESPLFPGYFVNYTIGNHAIQMVFDQGLSSINVRSAMKQQFNIDGLFVRTSEPNPGASITFEKADTVNWGNIGFRVSVEYVTDRRGWAIMARQHSPKTDRKEHSHRFLWSNPVSQTPIFPPRKSWKPVDNLVQGSVSIEYNFGRPTDQNPL